MYTFCRIDMILPAMILEPVNALIQSVKPYADAIVLGPLEQIGGILTDRIGYVRLKNQVSILEKSKAMCEASGIDPKKILADVFVPLMEEGGNTSDEKLQDMFARLLTTHLDPQRQDVVHPSFAKILGQLSPLDAKLLCTIDEWEKREWERLRERRAAVSEQGMFDRTKEEPWGWNEVLEDLFQKYGKPAARQLMLSVENLERLGLAVIPEAAPFQWREVTITSFGARFLAASLSPTDWRYEKARTLAEWDARFRTARGSGETNGGQK